MTTIRTRTNSSLGRGHRAVARFPLLVASLLLAMACAPGRPSANATGTLELHSGPLTDFVAAGGLRWMVVARVAELWGEPKLRSSLELLFPPARLDGFAKLTGVDLREVPTGLVAGFDYATLFMAETGGHDAQVERLFVDRLAGAARVDTDRRELRRLSGAEGSTPESLVHIPGRLVAVSIGDPTPARVVELYAFGRLARAPTALRGSSLSTLPAELETAPLRLYATGPFPDDWARGARGLLGAALAIGVGVWPDGDGLRLQVVFSGSFRAEDAIRLAGAWSDLAESTMGRLLALDQTPPPEVGVTTTRLTLSQRVATAPLVSGLRAAVAADVWEFLNAGAKPNKAPPKKK